MARLSSPVLLAGLPAGAAVAHAAAPGQFDATVPRSLPGSPRTWTYAGGVAELVLAAGVAHPRTRRAAAPATAAFFVGAGAPGAAEPASGSRPAAHCPALPALPALPRRQRLSPVQSQRPGSPARRR
ncbi:hypothetical protein ACIBTP_16940 [Streptomyces avidinii]|uniref:hypothetical protein n=1 Tax=Streptomyces avidinii TaxID=1895 RepID=UPI0037BAC10F